MKALVPLLLLLLCQAVSAQQSEALWRLGGHEGEVTSLLFSPDSRTLYTGSSDGLLRVWAPLDRHLVRTIESGAGSITSMAISGDGKRLAVAGLDGSIRLWDLGDMRIVRTMQADLPIRSIVMTPDGRLLLTGHGAGDLLVWNLDSARIVRRLVGHTADINMIALSPDATTVASASSDFSLRLWDIATGTETKKIFIQGNDFTAVAFSPDGTRLVANAGVPDAPDALKLTIFELPSMTVSSAPNAGHRAAILGLAFSPDSRFLASISEDYYLPGFIPGMSIVVSDLSGARPQFRMQEGNLDRYPTTVRFSPDGRFMAWGLTPGIVRVYEIGEEDDPQIFSSDRMTLTDFHAPLRAVAIAHGGSVVAAASDTAIRLFDGSSGRPTGKLDGHREVVTAIDFTADAATIASASADRTVRLWDVASGRERRAIYVSPEYAATAVGFSSDGARFVAGLQGGDSTIGIWDTSSSTPVRMFRGHPGGVTDVVLSPDGESVVSSGEDGRVLVWDMTTGEMTMTLMNGVDRLGVTSLALSANGRVLAAATSAGTIRTWSFPSGDPLVTLAGHTGPVTSIDISDDGSFLVSSGSDRTVRVWSVDNGALLHRYIDHPFAHTAIALDAESRRIVTGSADATLSLWPLVTVAAVEEHRAMRTESPITVLSAAPNPLLDRTTIELEMARGGELEAAIFNAFGEKIATLHTGWLPAGRARFEWLPDRLPPGSYFYRLSSQGSHATGRIVLLGR